MSRPRVWVTHEGLHSIRREREGLARWLAMPKVTFHLSMGCKRIGMGRESERVWSWLSRWLKDLSEYIFEHPIILKHIVLHHLVNDASRCGCVTSKKGWNVLTLHFVSCRINCLFKKRQQQKTTWCNLFIIFTVGHEASHGALEQIGKMRRTTVLLSAVKIYIIWSKTK